MRRPLFVAIMCVVTMVALSGGAHAFFRTTGAGSGSATTGTLHAVGLVAVGATQTATTTLVPGGTADLVLQINNTNSYNVTLVGVTSTAGSVTATPFCTTPGVSVANVGALSIPLVPGTQRVDVTNGATMSTSSTSDCQGATFSVPVQITVHEP